MLINSKSLLRYIRFMEMNSGNSVTQGPHQVTHTLISLSLSELFVSSSRMPASPMVSRLTGSFAQACFDLLIQSLFSAHLMEQPNTLVVATGTGFPASRASIAFRVSNSVGVLVGFSISSILPLYRRILFLSKINTCGVAIGP